MEQTITAEQVESLPDDHGFCVYLLWGQDQKTPLYVGQSISLRRRLRWHMSDPEKRRLVQTITIIECPSLQEMRATESALIRDHQPVFNRKGVITTLTGGGWGSDGLYSRIEAGHGLSYYDIEVLSRPLLPPISVNRPIAEIPEWQYYAVITTITWLRALIYS